MNTVMIVTGESSGELYGSLLAKALKEKCPDMRIIGIGGERMKEAGVELISGIASSFGIFEMISSYKILKETFAKGIDAMNRFSPKVLVLIDYPDFNMRLAKIAKTKGIKVLYYVSPQVWAWRKGRVKTIKDISDRIAVILPFEQSIYRETGAWCEFVGHPVLEEIESLEHDKTALKKSLGLNPGMPVLALLPGSRPHELNRLLPVILETVRHFKKEFRDHNYQFAVPIAPNIDIKKYETITRELEKEGVAIKKENAVKILSASDMAVIASGTAAFQSALIGTPMVVIYKLSLLSFLLANLIVDVKYISLVNIISGRGVVKELVQSNANPGNIINELKTIMFDSAYREQMVKQFKAVRELFEGKHPSARVAEIVCEMTA